MSGDRKGFTLIELMVSLAIVGILIATAVPVYQTWQQRARGAEALRTLNDIIVAEKIFYNDDENNDEFYKSGETISIYHDSANPPDAVEMVWENLNIKIPQGHFINYDIYADKDFLYIVVSSHGNFNLFKGASQVYVEMHKDEKPKIEYASEP